MCLDVESLFINVPVDAAIQAAPQKLENNPSLADRTTLTPAQISDFLTFVLRPHTSSTTNQFTNNEKAQPWEVRFPLNVIANLYMESFEEQAITTSPAIW